RCMTTPKPWYAWRYKGTAWPWGAGALWLTMSAAARWLPPATDRSASSAAIGWFGPTGRTNSQASRPSSAGYGSKRQPFLHRPPPRRPRSYCFSGKTIQAILGTYILDSLIKKAPKWGKTRGESRCLTLPAGFLVPLLLLGWGAFP